MRSLLKTKSARICFFLVSTGIGIFSFFDSARFVRRTHARFVEQDLDAALSESQKLPLGPARAEDYLRRVKAIKTGWAPPEMKQALFDCIAAYERGLIATEAGRDASAESKAFDEASKRLAAIEQKYR